MRNKDEVTVEYRSPHKEEFNDLYFSLNIIWLIKSRMKEMEYMAYMPGLRHGKLFIGRPCKKRADDLLKLSRHQLKMVTAIYTACSCKGAPVHYGPA